MLADPMGQFDRYRVVSLLLAMSVAWAPQRASAEGPGQKPDAGGDNAPSRAAAQKHFQTAETLYQEGSYREAIAELDAAVALDPKAKELYFNLGVVHEKLGHVDEALSYFRQYAEFDLTPQERGRAEKNIRRLEGAKRSQVGNSAGASPSTDAASSPTSGAGADPKNAKNDKRDRSDGGADTKEGEATRSHGRIDAATVIAAVVTVVAAGAGTYFGVNALSTRPTGYVTGRDGSYDNLKSQTDKAHTSAMLSDIGFGTAIAAGVTTAILYFGRTANTTPRQTALTAVPVRNGGVVLVGGSF